MILDCVTVGIRPPGPKAAAWHVSVALHEQHNLVLGQESLNLRTCIQGTKPWEAPFCRRNGWDALAKLGVVLGPLLGIALGDGRSAMSESSLGR